MKAKGKKGDEELFEDMRDNLKLDIDILENDIHLEEMRETNAIKKYEELITKTYAEQNIVDSCQRNKNDIIKNKMLSLQKVEVDKNKEIVNHEESIEKLVKDIVALKEEDIEKDKEYARQEKERDEAIQSQRKLFLQMAEKFYKILINTQSKTEEETKLVQEVIKKANES